MSVVVIATPLLHHRHTTVVVAVVAVVVSPILRDNPVLERTIPREMLEIIEAAKKQRQGNGRDDATTDRHPDG